MLQGRYGRAERAERVASLCVAFYANGYEALIDFRDG